jgi:hypothetical protein
VAPNGSGFLTTITLVNTSGSTQAANFVTPRFGHSFKKGDVPSGTAPQFIVSGAPQPYSWGLQSYWSDGSLKHASFMFLCTSSIAGNGTLSVGVSNGGTAPANSGRSLTDVYNQNIQINMPGIGSFGGLSGNWYAYITNDANLIKAYKILDGQAGASFYIAVNAAQSGGGPAHGQLIVEDYVTVLNDSGGGIGGFRHHPRITQPYYNYDAPAKSFRAFSSLSWGYGAGSQYGTPTRTVNWNWPFKTINLVGTSGSPTFTVASSGTHNFYGGAGNGYSDTNYINGVPGYLTSTTDGALATGQIYWAFTTTLNNNTQLWLSKDSGGDRYFGGYIQSTGGNSTFVPIPVCNHFNAVRDGNTDGTSKFFQGTGSFTSDCTIRTQFNQVYAHSTGLIPPWTLTGPSFTGTISGTTLTVSSVVGDLIGIGLSVAGAGVSAGTKITAASNDGVHFTVNNSQSVGPVAMTTSLTGTTFGGTVQDITAMVGNLNQSAAPIGSVAYWTGTPIWTPVSCGPISPAERGAPGQSPDIGPSTLWHAAHFYNQSAVGDMAIRAIAFASDFDATGSFRDHANFQYINVSNTTYTGVTAPSALQQSTLYYLNNTQVSGFTAPSNPPNGSDTIWGGQCNNAHKPSMAWYAFWAFGEDYFHQIMIEAGIGQYLQVYAPNRAPSSPLPTGYGITTGPTLGGLRSLAWAYRDTAIAAALCASNHPDGSQICQYIRDLIPANSSWMNNFFSSTYIGSALAAQNRWNHPADLSGNLDPSDGGFMMSYWIGVVSWIAMACEDSGCKTWLNNYSTWLNWQLNNVGGIAYYVEYDHAVVLDSSGNGTTGISSLNDYGIISGTHFLPNNGTMSWVPSSPSFTVPSSFGGYTPANGDFWIFDASETVPNGFSAETKYISLNVSGDKFDLSANGSTPIAPGSTGSLAINVGLSEGESGPWLVMKNPPAAATGIVGNGCGLTQADSYCMYRYAAYNWARAAGATGYGAAGSGPVGDVITRATFGGPANFSQNPNWFIASGA